MVSEHIARSYERKILVPEGILGRKKKAMTIHVTKDVRKEATLLAEKEHLRALLEEHGINVDEKIEKAIEKPIYSLHHPDKNPYNKYETEIRVAAPTEEDSAKYTTLLQIISIPLAARTKSYIDPKIGLEHAMWPAVDRRGDPRIIVGVDEEQNLEKKMKKRYTHMLGTL